MIGSYPAVPSLPPDPDTERFLQSSLEPGEVIRWSAAPSPWRLLSRVFLASGFSLAIFAALTAFALRDYFSPGAGSPPPVVLLAYLPLTLFLLGVPVWTYYAAQRCVYAVTDRRAVIAEPRLFGSTRIRSFSPPFLGLDKIAARADGGGDLVLGSVTVRGRYGSRQRATGFFGLTDLAPAQQALRALTESSARQPGGPTALLSPPAPRARAVAVLFGLIGAGLILYGAYTAQLAYRSTRWPTTLATILNSQVRVVHGRHTSYHADVRYEYDVAGRTYQASRIAFGGVAGSYNGAATIVRRYPFNALVPVSYDPSDPARSVLEPGPGARLWFMPGFGVFMLFVGWFSCRAVPTGRRIA